MLRITYIKLILLVISCLFTHVSNAQKWWQKSEVQQNDKTKFTYALLDFDSSSYRVLRFDKSRYYAEIESYDSEMRLRKTTVTTDERRRYAGVMNINKRMYLFYFRFKKNNVTENYEDISFLAKQIDSSTLKVTADSIVLIPPFNLEGKEFKGDLVLSPDRSKFLIYSYEDHNDIEGVSGLTNEVHLRVFDNEFNPIWERVVNLSPDGGLRRQVSIKKLHINNEGQVTVVTDIFKSERTYSSKKVTADPSLFFVDQAPADVKRFTPNLGEDLFFNNCNISYDAAGDINWFGFYSKKKYYMQSGLFFIKIKKDLSKVITKQIHKFSPELIAQMMGKRKISQKREAAFFRFTNWHHAADSSFLLVSEHQPTGSLFYKSHRIMVTQLDSLGKVGWHKIIPKYSTEAYKLKPFLSNHSFLQGGQLHILYNTGVEEVNGIQHVKITPEGSISNKSILKYNRHIGLLCPRLSSRLPNNKLFCCFQDKYFSYYRFAILDLDKAP